VHLDAGAASTLESLQNLLQRLTLEGVAAPLTLAALCVECLHVCENLITCMGVSSDAVRPEKRGRSQTNVLKPRCFESLQSLQYGFPLT